MKYDNFPKIVRAYVRRWWFCLWRFEHWQELTAYDNQDRIVLIAALKSTRTLSEFFHTGPIEGEAIRSFYLEKKA
jgi:hypothetical protein